MDQLRQVLNRKALADEARRLTLLSIFGAEGEEEEEEDEEDDSDSDSDSEDEEDEDDSDSSTKSFPESYVKKLRNEAAANRKRAAELQKQLDEQSEKDLTEKEKAEKRAKAAEERAGDFEKRLNRTLISTRVEAVARSLHFIDPDDAASLLDISSLDEDEDGLPTTKAIRKALRKLSTDKSYLVSTTSGDGNQHGDNPPTDRVKDRTEELISKGRVKVE